MKGKRGWIRILEATIAVLIVSGAMMTVYSNQSAREDLTLAEVGKSFQDQMLSDIVENRTLRLDVLMANESAPVNSPGRKSYERVDFFVSSRVPEFFAHLLKVCELGSNSDYCMMDRDSVAETRDKDVFVEEVVVSSELGNGTNRDYSPKKVRLFFWEEDFDDGACSNECLDEAVCSDDLDAVLTRSCVENSDGCLEFEDEETEDCENGCSDGACVACVDTCVVGESYCSGGILREITICLNTTGDTCWDYIDGDTPIGVC